MEFFSRKMQGNFFVFFHKLCLCEEFVHIFDYMSQLHLFGIKRDSHFGTSMPDNNTSRNQELLLPNATKNTA